MPNMKKQNQTKKQTGALTDEAPRWGSGLRWGSGARWPRRAPLTNSIIMATITTNISNLNVLQKTEKGVNLINMGTDNPLVPGNAVPLAAFSTRQAALVAANEAVVGAREALKQIISARNAAETDWNDQCTQLAGFTQSATGGDATAILSSGFGVRAPNSPPPPSLPAPASVTATTNGSPGNTKVKWKGVQGAVSYLVEMSADPFTETSWAQVAAPTKTSCEVGGAEPGKVSWFRVATVSATGIGPWSAPAQRGVM